MGRVRQNKTVCVQGFPQVESKKDGTQPNMGLRSSLRMEYQESNSSSLMA